MPQAATTTRVESPYEHAGREGPVADQVRALRARARTEPQHARDQALAWIADLGRLAATDRFAALAELQHLFLCGEASAGIDGQTDGMLVTWTMHPVADRLVGAVTNAWMPWLGKKFYPLQERGENTLSDGARWPAKIPWPRYSTRDSPLGRTAFEFETYVEPGKLDPAVEVLVIDYGRVSENPRLLIRQVRDELVEVVPGAHLGRMLVNLPRRRNPVAALYFALKSEL